MYDTLSRSWGITKLSFGVIRRDSEMLLFPVLGSFFSLTYGLLVMFPTVLVHLMDPNGTSLVWGPLQWAASFLAYFGLAFIGTFFNTAVVYTTRKRFDGGDATFMESLSFAASRAPQIASWSLLAASVGLFMRFLDQLAERMGGIGEMVLTMLQKVLGLAWTVATVFVVPVMVYEGLGPIDAVKQSVETMRKTWGESLARHFGMGLIQFAAMVPGVLFLFVGLVAEALILPGILLAGAWFVVVTLVFNVANTVFNTALYEYARTGMVPHGFDMSVMQGAFVTSSRAR